MAFPRFGHLLVGRALGLRRAPRPARRQFCKIRRARLRAARRRSVCPTKTTWARAFSEHLRRGARPFLPTRVLRNLSEAEIWYANGNPRCALLAISLDWSAVSSVEWRSGASSGLAPGRADSVRFHSRHFGYLSSAETSLFLNDWPAAFAPLGSRCKNPFRSVSVEMKHK
jgi:hypothetical protein